MVSAQEGASIGAFCREQGISWRPEGDPLTCGYLGEDKECRIYSRRPLVCRLYGLIAELACPYHSEAVCTSLPADKALRDILGTTTLHLLAEVV
jgi:Fe-S-cluster containining protein